ncbi:MAG: ester cyclase [Acidobacteria bacterium]|nr:ester cyclase [Acidobacteriota bacterium]
MQEETVLHRWFDEVWNNKRESAIDELLAADSIHHGLGGPEGQVMRGTADFKQFHRAFLAAFPDLEVTVEDVVSDGRKFVARCTVRGTHTGEGLPIAPTGRRIEFTGIGMCIYEDGKFVEVWNEYDFMKMYSQLGVLSLNLE